MRDEHDAPRIELPAPVAGALERFAAVTRQLSIWQAAGWVVALTVGGFTLVALADRWLFIEDGSRQMLALAVYLAGGALGWWLLRGALRARSASELALQLEARVPKETIQERISTTVEIALHPSVGEGLSTAMIRRVADEAAQTAQSLPIEQIPDRGGARRACQTGGAVLAFALLLCLVPGLHMHLALVRAVLPWINLERPADTTIEVLTGNSRVVDGDFLKIQARVTGAKQIEATLETRVRGSSWQSVRMDASSEAKSVSPMAAHGQDDAHATEFQLKLGPVHEDMDYRVRAADGQSAAFAIEVLPRPEVTGMKAVVHYPEYTRLPPQTFEHLNGDISILKGARVELTVQSNTALSAGVLEFSDDRRVSMAAQEKIATCTLDVTQDTSYRVRLRSTDGVSNPDAPLFFVHAVPDLAPQVTVLKPQADEAVDVNAVLPLECRAEDDLGVVSARLVVQSEQRHEPRIIELERPPESDKVWMISQPWDLAGLFLDGSETITFRVEAVDSNGSVGKSDERRLRVAAGRKYQHSLLLAELQAAQKHVTLARRLLTAAALDVAEMRQVFRTDDTDFQAAERLLLAETLNRVSRETLGAAAALDKALPHAEAGALQTLLSGLANGLRRFSDTGLRPLHRAASRTRSMEGQIVAAGLDVVGQLLPEAAKDLEVGHEALTAGQRYAEATQLEMRANDIRDTQTKIIPVLVGAAGWTPKGTAVPGLQAEYFKGSLQTLLRRTVDTSLTLKGKQLPDAGREGLSVRWQGQILAPKAGRYTFRSADDGVRLSVSGKPVINQWNVQIVDNGDAGYVQKGEWVPAGGGYGNDWAYSTAGKGDDVATWTFSALTPGRYRVFVTWLEHQNRATDAPFTVLDGDRPLATVRVNQEPRPADLTENNIPWKDLGGQYAISSNTLVVKLTDQANEYVIADAVRIERAAESSVQSEGAVELTEGWHDISIEYVPSDRKDDLGLVCSGPDLPRGPISPERLRHFAASVAVTDGRVRQSMGKASSDSAVKHALTRLQTIVATARALPVTLSGIAGLPPKVDPQGLNEGSEWLKTVSAQTLELDGAKVAAPALAVPLLQWGDQGANWAHAYKAVRERYRQAMQHWANRLALNVFKKTAEIKQLEQDAAAATQAFNTLAQTAQMQPNDPKREAAMARADATVRALAEDLKTQATMIAAELRQDSKDVTRPVEERQALQALAQKAEAMARGTAADLDRRLAEAKTPEALAKSQQTTPNFGQQTTALQQQAAQLAQMSEKVERALALRDELNDAASDMKQGQEALKKAPSAETAAEQQQAAAELKEMSNELQAAVQAASQAVRPEAIHAASQVAHNPTKNTAAELLEKRAAETLNTAKPDANNPNTAAQQAAAQKARADTAAELGRQAQAAEKAADAVEKSLGQLAQEWSGDPARPLQEAAANAAEAGKAMADLPKDKPPAANMPALDKAAHNAEDARRKAEHTAENLALRAEAMRDEPAANPQAKEQQQNRADDFARLAAAINNEVQEKLTPAADLLDRARRDPSEEARLPKDAPTEAQAAAGDLNKFAEIAAKLNSADPNVQKQGHDELAKKLAEKGIAEETEAALKEANALDQIADRLEKAAEAGNTPPAQSNQPDANDQAKSENAAKTAEALEAERQALAKALGMDAKNEDQQMAIAEKMGELAQELRKESDHTRQTADYLDQARGMEDMAREKLKKEGAKMAQELRAAGKEAGESAKAAQGQQLAAPLANAGKSLPQAAQTTENAAQQAESAPMGQLAQQLEQNAQALEKPMAELAAHLGQNDDKHTQAAQKIGQKAGDIAGDQAELAEEFKRAERAQRLAREGADAASGDRESLEEQVRAAIEALDKQGALPGAMIDDLAALKDAAKAGQKSGQAEAGGQKAEGQGKPGEAGSKPGQGGEKPEGQNGQPGQKPQGGEGQGGQQNEPSLQTAARNARAESDRMAQMAARMERLAQGLTEGKKRASKPQDSDAPSHTPAADAMEALAQAEAAAQTGDAAEAQAMADKAAGLLDQAAEAARANATGQPQPGSMEAQSNAAAKGEKTAQGKGEGKPNEGKGKGQQGKPGQGQPGSKSDPQGGQQTASKGGIAPNPPPGIPIDKATWNRLPDDLRRDLLNASGGRFPAEYETSIRRYFKNLAATKEEGR